MQLHAGRLKVIPADELPKMASAHPERSMQGVRVKSLASPSSSPASSRAAPLSGHSSGLSSSSPISSDLIRSHPISSSTPIHPAEVRLEHHFSHVREHHFRTLVGIPNMGVPDASQMRDDFQTLVGIPNMGVPDASQIRDDFQTLVGIPYMGVPDTSQMRDDFQTLVGIPNLGVPDASQIRDDFQTLVGMLDMDVPDASQIRDDGPSRLPNMGLSAAPMPQSPNMESERRMPHITSVWQLDTETYGATRVATAIPDELIEAAQVGNAVRVRDWLWAGGDVDGRDSTGRTMLMFAAAAGRSAVVEVLLAAR
jgi:pyrimidine operon attenuation protein/uracil phosphoribosyltransferase